MVDRNKIALLATALFVTLPLVVLSFDSKYLAAISLQPVSEEKAQVPCKSTLTEVDGSGRAFFDFRSTVLGAVDEVLFLEIRAIAERDYRRQGDGYKVVRGGMVSGIAELGSIEWPLRGDEEYRFRLVDGRGSSVLDGTILARVYSVDRPQRSAVVAIGVLASILQILVTFWPRRSVPRATTN